MALSAFAVSLVPYANTKLKCLSAAVFGYAAADFLVCAIWYSLEFGGYFFAASMHLAGFVSAGALYLFRSYEPVHEEPDPNHVYCLRHRPNDLQSLLISMAGFFGPDGSYAIYCRDNVYRFRRGVMVCEPYQTSMYVKYNSKRGNIATDHTQRSLDAMVGIKWRLFGSNCLTVLMPFWKKNNATDGTR